jgi:hypothetical protein
MLGQQEKLPQRTSHLIGRQINAGLKGNQKQCVATVAENIKGHLVGGETKEAWQCLKGWYKATSKRTPSASPMLLATQTAKCVALYRKVPSPGEPLFIHVNKVDIPDGVPSDGDLRAVVRGLQNGRTAGGCGLQAEHIKVWLTDVVCKKEEQSDVGLGEKWWIFVKLMQAVWEQGSIPEQMKWKIIVLLPKGGGDYPGIGLLEPFWKVIEKIMVAQLLSVEFHDSLHGGLLGRGAGTTTIKAKHH